LIREVDLNEISHVNPFIFKLSGRAKEDSRLSGNLSLGESVHESLLNSKDNSKEAKKPIRLNKLRVKRNENWMASDSVVYGVQIKKMRKVLVIRTPYVFNNRTKMVYEMRVVRMMGNEEVARLKLAAESKCALDF
jgi:hypothetical protein